MRSRSRGLAALVLASIGLSLHPVGAGGQDDSAAPRQRSVLFYLMDTCRSDRMSFDGYARQTTPFLKWLAERSVVFEACYSQAPWTKPSMASMLSSRYPSTTGVYRVQHQLAAEVLTWPEVLQANGMVTAGFSANINMGNTLSNFAQGFDHFVESTLVNRADPIRFASGSARLLNEHAFAWLDSTDAWPILLYLHSVDPHEEYEPEPSYLEQFADPARHERFRQEWQKLLQSRPTIPGLYVTQDNFDRTRIDSASFIEHSSNLYDADILANDDQLQRLWDKLQEDGWGEDFIFVFTSDHGEEFFDHGGTSHGYSLYDEMVRVPLMIYAPGLLPAGKKVETPVGCLDIYPTLCDLLGLDLPEGLQGESLVPLIHGQAASGERRIFSEHREDPVLRRMGLGSGVMVSLRTGRWKFILNQTSSQLIEKPRFELFDLEADPAEKNNVADLHPDLVKQLELEVVDFVANHREGAAVEDWMTMDPQVLEQLRALGYLGEEEDEPDLWAAVEAGDTEQVRRCLAAGASPDQQDELFGATPLAMASMAGDVELAEVLLEGGASVDARNLDGSTPLTGAAFLGRVDMLMLLLEMGADPNVKNTNGDSVLSATQAPWDATEYIAGLFGIQLDREEVEAGRAKCAELLWAAQKASAASPGQDEPDRDPTGRLFRAIEAANMKAVEEALAAGASLEERDSVKGWTPLYQAVFLGRDDIARLLLEKGASVHARNKDMGSPLHAAALMGRAALLELLIENGAYVDARDGTASTPLHASAFLGRVEAVVCLLRAEAGKSLKNEDGKTALDVTRTDWEITAYLIKLLGLDLPRAGVEKNRVKVAKLLRE